MHITIDGIKLNYIDEGCGTNVLLLHGWGANIKTMQPIFDILKNRCRVVALDLPGFGESEKPFVPWNSYDYVDIVKKFIDSLSLNNIILIGHSHGGRVSIILSSIHQNLVRKLILIDSAGIIPKRALKYYYRVYKYKLFKKLYLLFNKNNQYKLETFYKKFGSEDYKNAENEIIRKTLVKVLNDNIESHLTNIKTPTLIIWGELDMDTPLYMAEKLNEKIQNSGLVILEGAKHYSYLDNFYKFKLVLESFLSNDFTNTSGGVL